MTSDPALRIFPIADGICYGLREGVFLMAYRRAPNAEELRARRRLLDSLRDRQDGYSFLTVIDTGLSQALPSPATRDEMTQQARDYESRIERGAYVLTGGGVFEPLLRTLVRGALRFGRGGVKYQFCGSIEEAARFVTHNGRKGDPVGTARAVETLLMQVRDEAAE
ncbi:MAG: hypothetical protein CMN30_03625 [Sandaracinus sp.]|nr:hypothetical protein [Sandaracinus sp.]|tara:strand:- start:219 stop:716 length:498 start_codon:yes stop_codon:yes gene_type:complete